MYSEFSKLTILVDNVGGSSDLKTEHGLSMLIRAGGKNILIDAGQHDALEHNVGHLGINLSHLDAFVLSHGHYDHTGAVDFVLQECPHVPVYAHPHILKKRYSIYPGKNPKEISMPSEERLLIENLPDTRLHWVMKPTEIADRIWLTGPVPRKHPAEDTGGPFFIDPEGKEADPILDDQSIWIETPNGLLVICGCCHSGLINTLDYILEYATTDKIWCIIGGLHLKNASGNRLNATVEKLKELQPEFIVPCHCTGKDAITYFKENTTIPIHAGFAGFRL